MTDEIEPPHPVKANMIDDFGRHIGHAMSWPPTAGRVFGIIMLHGAGLTLHELQTLLNVSVGSVSESTRLLILSGVVERIRVPGSRRHRYRYRDDAWIWCLQHQIELTSELLDLARRSRRSADGLPDRVQQRLRDMDAYYTFMTSHLTELGVRFRQDHTQDARSDTSRQVNGSSGELPHAT